MLKEKILVVDDEQDLVKLVKFHLAKEGYRVITAFNPTSHLQMPEPLSVKEITVSV